LPTSLILKHKLNFRHLFLRIFRRLTAPLNTRDITNSAYICNTLQCSKIFLHSWCITTVCDTEMSVHKCVKEPVSWEFVREGTCPREGGIFWGALFGGTCPGGIRPDIV